MSNPETNLPLYLALLALSEQATRDWLTGLHNRRYFEETLADHIAAARRYSRTLSLVLFDIDHFKQINDTRGHAGGDAVLRAFATQLKTTARTADIVCRYGGDEFAILLPETSLSQAHNLLERLPPAAGFSVTTGLAALPSDDLVADADADLLAKKEARLQTETTHGT